MMADPSYKNTASRHRGEFLEQAIVRFCEKAFGKHRVFLNVIIKKNKADIAAEADVLIIYGEFILVVQAKSKRLTLAARSGDFARLEANFKSAVQAAYDQAVKFATLVLSGVECQLSATDRRIFNGIARVFPVVVLSDHFPSLNSLTGELIKTRESFDPAVIDVFFLEVLFSILQHSIEILYYLQQRTRFFRQVHADSELEILGYHLKQKLYVGSGLDFIMLDKGFAADIDNYFLAKKSGHPTAIEFLPMEERIRVPAVTSLIRFLKSGPPEIAGTAIELFDFSEDGLQDIAENIATVQAEVRGGKALKAFSVDTQYGGISYVAVDRLHPEAVAMADAVGRRHKYRARKDRWYVLLDNVHSENVLDGVLPILEKWEESEDMQRVAEDVGKLMKSTWVRAKRALPAGTEDASAEPV